MTFFSLCRQTWNEVKPYGVCFRDMGTAGKFSAYLSLQGKNILSTAAKSFASIRLNSYLANVSNPITTIITKPIKKKHERFVRASDRVIMPPEEGTSTTQPPPPPASGRRARWRVAEHTRASCTTVVANTLCTLLLVLLLVAGVVLFVVWLSLRPHRPRFAVVSFTVVSPPATGGGGHQKVAFNVSDRNPNRHIGIHYDATRAAVLYGGDDVGAAAVLVATGPAFADGWYQPNKTTTYIAGVLDVVGPRPSDAAWPAFAAGLRAGRLPLRLRLTTAIRFRLTTGFGAIGLQSGRRRMHVDCHIVVDSGGNLLPESVGAACERYFS